ncbi:BTB/POZ protein [Glomus cerebriforme]|uniref:BTB/POZ protein n=1 Tax=Glomus cerebriforme TaxID=658196 RepID=A0A397SGZ0_9GLOM|nr:BTB/POZ protein [Glomus cerebriforme]
MDDVKQKSRKRVRVTVEVPQELSKISVKTNETTDEEREDYKAIPVSSPKPYARGDSLTIDLSEMVNNPLYSDIIITCKDKEEFHACKLLLAARSEYFNRLLFSSTRHQTKSSHIPNKITISELTSSAVKVVLEYLYTGKVSDKTLTIDIVSDAYNGATFFLLPNLKKIITRFMKSYMKHCHNVSSSNQIAKILSKVSENSISTDDNQLIDAICKFLMSKSLYKIDYQNLSSKALEFLLSYTLNIKEGNVATTEYDIFRYCILWAVNQISMNDVLYFLLLLPSNEDLEGQKGSGMREWNPIDPNNSLLQKHKATIISMLKPILNFIDFHLIHPSILANIIEPLGIVEQQILNAIYRDQAVGGFAQMKRGVQE